MEIDIEKIKIEFKNKNISTEILDTYKKAVANNDKKLADILEKKILLTSENILKNGI